MKSQLDRIYEGVPQPAERSCSIVWWYGSIYFCLMAAGLCGLFVHLSVKASVFSVYCTVQEGQTIPSDTFLHQLDQWRTVSTTAGPSLHRQEKKIIAEKSNSTMN